MDPNQTIHVKINSPDKVLWEGEALSLSSENSSGPFDILGMHTNFVTFVDKKITLKTPKETLDFTFPRAIIYNHKNMISIFANV